MKCRLAALLPLILTVTACATDGGSRGSGIFTIVQGNVAGVRTAAANPQRASHGIVADVRAALRIATMAHAQTMVEGIRVAVEGTAIQDQTDAAGRFTVQGDFEGRLNLVFQLAGDEGGTARIAINVPAGGTLTLNNVYLDTENEEANAETQDVDFTGTITGAYCTTLTMTMESIQKSSTDQDQYVVRLDTSTVQDAQGNTLSCADLNSGQRAALQGHVNPDGTFGNAEIQVED